MTGVFLDREFVHHRPLCRDAPWSPAAGRSGSAYRCGVLCLLAATLALVRGTALRRLGTTKTLCVLFFSLAVAHIFFGFLMANLTTEHTSIRSNAEVYYANAFLIDSVGLLAAALGYSWKLNGRAIDLRRGFLALADPEVAEPLFRVLLLAGAAMMFLVYWRLGFLDYLWVPAKWPFLRYITSDIAGGSARDEWFANRAMDLLTVALPFLVYRAVKRPRIVGHSLDRCRLRCPFVAAPPRESSRSHFLFVNSDWNRPP